MNKLTCLCIAHFLCLIVSAQLKYSIRGRVISDKDQPIELVTIAIHRSADSALLKTVVSDAEGNYVIAGIEAGTIYLNFSASGYNSQLTRAFALQRDTSLPDMQMNSVVANLSTALVVAKRPLIEQKFDKLIFNVSNNISVAGSSALETLGKAPGVLVDAEGNISLNGRGAVLVLIDGKRTHLGPAELAAYLRGLPASVIERIELIATPSAQYEAEGTSGIIDIRLKKDNRDGYNGSVNAAGLIRSALSGNTSTNFNYRRKKLNLFGNISGSYDDVNGQQIADRSYYRVDGALTGTMHTNNDREIFSSVFNSRIGFDVFANKRTVWGVTAMASTSKLILDYGTRLENFYVPDSTDYSVNTSYTKSRRNNQSINFNVKHQTDTLGGEWNLDIDYAHFTNGDRSRIESSYFNAHDLMLRPVYKLAGNSDGGINVYALRFDYQFPTKSWGTLQAGVRSSKVRTDNDLLFTDVSGSIPVRDTGRSNHFIYAEKINAGYLNFQRKMKSIQVQLGVRMEHTSGAGKQFATFSRFDRQYVQVFPNFFISNDFSKKYSASLSVSRRIDRPSYQQLNPFRFYATPESYTEGNPRLIAPCTFTTELTQTFFRRFIVRINYSETNDLVSLVFGTDPFNERISAQKPVNIDKLMQYRLSLTAPFTIGNWFTSFNNVIAGNSRYKGRAFNSPLNRSLPWWYVSSTNTFRTTHGFSFELTCFYRSSQLSGGYQRLDPIYGFGAGAGKTFWNGLGNLRMNITDLFRTNVFIGKTTLTGYVLLVRQWNETRRFTVSFTYNFGKTKLAASRNRSSGAEEEKGRAQ